MTFGNYITEFQMPIYQTTECGYQTKLARDFKSETKTEFSDFVREDFQVKYCSKGLT